MNDEGTIVEVLRNDASDRDRDVEPPIVEAYIAVVEPQDCAPLIDQTSQSVAFIKALASLTHLKRVRKNVSSSVTEVDDAFPEAKKARPSPRLHVLLGLTSELDNQCLMSLGGISKIEKTFVPSRLARSEDEHRHFQTMWPIKYYPNGMEEHRELQTAPSPEEVEQMHFGISQAFKVANQNCRTGAVIIDSATGDIVSTSGDEMTRQGNAGMGNPLATATILAIQGVSRMERSVALKRGMDDPEFQQGQYLCTGYDVYCTHEPTVFEAMALVHARVRRLVFCFPAKNYLGGITPVNVHALGGTNHKYRAFRYRRPQVEEQS